MHWLKLRKEEVWEAVIIATAVALFMLMFAGSARSAEIEWLVEAQHTSDLLRGDAPWAKHVPEPYHDCVMTGITITMPKHPGVEVDLSQGWKRLAGTAGNGDWQTGTTARLRWYPLRRVRF